jgi:hypothetical protein
MYSSKMKFIIIKLSKKKFEKMEYIKFIFLTTIRIISFENNTTIVDVSIKYFVFYFKFEYIL